MKEKCRYCNHPTHDKVCTVCEMRIDEFAGQALCGEMTLQGDEKRIAEFAYRYAEAMMQERKKRVFNKEG